MTNTAAPASALQGSQRDYWFDNAKAILIAAVVVGHLANGLFSTSVPWVVALQKYIYIFHMPAFMIISGRFAKKRIDRGDWVSVINKLIIPYVVLQTVMLIVYSVTDYAGTGSFSYLKPLFGLWYFFILAVYSLISPKIVKHKWALPVSLALGLAAGFLPGTPHGGFTRVFAFYPFFLFGYFTYSVSFDFCKKIWFRAVSFLAMAALGVFTLMNNHHVSFELLCMNETYDFIAEDVSITITQAFLENILRYAAGFICFMFIMGLSPVKKTFFTYIGENSNYVYALHLFIIVILRAFDEQYDLLRVLTNKWLLLAYCASGVALAFILASTPVRRATRFMVAPDIDIRKIFKKIIGE